MKKDWISITKKTYRLKLTFLEFFLFYSFGIAPLAISFIPLLGIINMLSIGNELSEIIPFIILWLLFFLPAVTVFLFQYRNMEFKEFKATISNEQFQEAIDLTASELNWHIIYNDNDYFRARRRIWGIIKRWDIEITIIKGEKCLLINSVAHCGLPSFGWNDKNIKTFLKNLSDVLDTQI
jgi:hypothetical protein